MPENGQDGEHRTPTTDDAAAPSAPTATAAAAPGPSAAGASAPPVDRMQRFTPANMIRSLLPLVAVCLVIVGVTALRQNPEDPIREVEIAGTVARAATAAGHPLPVPQGLPDAWRPTSVRGDLEAPVTLQIGWYTPGEEYAGFVVSDDPDADPLTDVLDGATGGSPTEVDGETWQRLTSERGETVLTRTDGPSTLLVTGSATDAELEQLAAAVEPLDP
ncbi:DUF4245 domain-containing protein [Modestobacter roseus]|uniref:Uncharacterized protein DUF4245 n=1 Tax=Modestobacter roseus TaxID=1181884 RepID=A0A562IL83_9ACTN|nr:DUF4245 domain-containing protein [Modestobacter roseus]MQA32138.1 DUF4245 family protein [Modestobacter roseus]TWH71632.1 uncharacterized protein DUF4245 [Modestobacter roseus]